MQRVPRSRRGKSLLYYYLNCTKAVIPEIDVATLAARIAAGDSVTIIDVREPWENELASIPGAKLIPMSEFVAASESLDKDAEYVIHCHHGGRSGRVVDWMQAQGFTNATNLAGGVDAWSEQIDPSVKRY